MAKKKNAPAPTSNLPAIRRANQQVGQLLDLQAQAFAARLQASSPRTLKEYGRCWRKFAAWCEAQGLQPLPAETATVAAYVSWLVNDQNYAAKSMDQAIAAIKWAHQKRMEMPICSKDWGVREKEGLPIGWKESGLSDVLKGLRRKIAERRSIKQARAITDADAREILDLMRPDVLREIRDAAVIMGVYAGCRRRSELVGLDYKERGSVKGATGVLDITPDGISITLHASKTHQEGGEPERYFINKRNTPRACKAIEAWIRLAAIAPGTAVFRGIRGTGTASKSSGHFGIHYNRRCKAKPYATAWRGVSLGRFATEAEARAARSAKAAEDGVSDADTPVCAGRMVDAKVNIIIKRRMFQILCKRMLEESGRKRLKPEEVEQCKQDAATYSGHSGRRGSITAAAERGRRLDEIMQMSGHKSVPIVQGYIQRAEVKRNNFMEGSGL